MGVKSKLSSKMALCCVAFLSAVNLTESNTDLETHVTSSQAIKHDFHEFVYFAWNSWVEIRREERFAVHFTCVKIPSSLQTFTC